jgi:alkanesulfonate monooxygenase SsuD/methylene tetrahydromethanopterin reductase-like flavin-dependent oxidoreductase (luciferase family)
VAPTLHIPVGLNLASIGVAAEWWLDSVRRAEAAGFGSAWIWDHFVSRGRLSDPVLECWTMLAAATRETSTIRLGSFVSNVMNRHPAVLARMVATASELSHGRIELGIGAGGHPAEHEAYGIPFPPRPERGEHVVEAIDVMRHLFSGGPVDYEGDHYRLSGAHAYPVPRPAPRIVLGGETPTGARLAARHADAWTCFSDHFEALVPVFRAELAAAGRDPSAVAIRVGVEPTELGGDRVALPQRWRDRGGAEIIVQDVRPGRLEDILTLAKYAAGDD